MRILLNLEKHSIFRMIEGIQVSRLIKFYDEVKSKIFPIRRKIISWIINLHLSFTLLFSSLAVRRAQNFLTPSSRTTFLPRDWSASTITNSRQVRSDSFNDSPAFSQIPNDLSSSDRRDLTPAIRTCAGKCCHYFCAVLNSKNFCSPPLISLPVTRVREKEKERESSISSSRMRCYSNTISDDNSCSCGNIIPSDHMKHPLFACSTLAGK